MVDPVDGRVARRQRNVDAVLDVVIEMFTEDLVFPTIEQAAKRSGLSLRTLYRFFSDPSELIQAAVARQQERTLDLVHVPSIGRGSFDERVTTIVEVRMQMYDQLAPVFRASVHNAPLIDAVARQLGHGRRELREQVALQFAPELKAATPGRREMLLDAADALMQFDSIEYLRRSCGRDRGAIAATLAVGLTGLFEPT